MTSLAHLITKWSLLIQKNSIVLVNPKVPYFLKKVWLELIEGINLLMIMIFKMTTRGLALKENQ